MLTFMGVSSLSEQTISPVRFPSRPFLRLNNVSSDPQVNVIAHQIYFKMEAQLQTNWCWSAVAVSTGLFYQTGKWTQCDTANHCLDLTTCCSKSCPAACNVYGYLETSLAYTKSFNSYVLDPEKKDDLVTQINFSQPVGTRVRWTAGGAHFNLITGYSYPELTKHNKKNTDKEDMQITIQDPIYGTTYIKYSDYPKSYQAGGTWTTSYLTQNES